jgi:hypothetical protein
MIALRFKYSIGQDEAYMYSHLVILTMIPGIEYGVQRQAE